MTQGLEHGDIDSLATLARSSRLSDKRDDFQRQLAAVVVYLEQLKVVDTDGVEEWVAPLPLATPLREDLAAAPIDRAAILAGAPVTQNDLVIVPRFVDG